VLSRAILNCREGAKLLHQGKEIGHAPMLGDLPVAHAHDVDGLELNFSARRRHPEKLPKVRPMIGLVGRYPVAIGKLPMDYRAPAILIGHSLGGAAVLAAAHRVPEATAVVTIGAPSDVAHVLHNFRGHLGDIERDGVADVTLAGRTFPISRNPESTVSRVRKAPDAI
jgi:fermentation-respiration switch protein FrsA (DUF1100 family)